MAAGRHYHSSVATLSSLGAAMTAAQATMVVPQATFLGYPASYPFTVRIEGGTANEELVDVTGAPSLAAGLLTYPVDRGMDGSTARTHVINSVIDHPITARDLEEAGAHVYGSTGVHGIAGGDSVLGTTDMTTHAGNNSAVHGASVSELLARCTNSIVMHRGSATVTTDASGNFTVTHGAPFTPSHVICWLRVVGGVGGAIVGTATYTATQFSSRIANQTSIVTVAVSFLCIGN